MEEKTKNSKSSRKQYWIFIDLEKAFDRVPRRLIIESLRHKRKPEHFLNAIMATYDDCKTSVIVDGEPTDAFDVTVGVHQGSILSPLLFITVINYLTEEVRGGSILEMLYADDIALAAETPEEVMRKYRMWKSALESKGLRVNVGKTKGMGDFPSVTRIAAVDPCGVCGTRVGRNSIMCTLCRKWVHGRCTGCNSRLLRSHMRLKKNRPYNHWLKSQGHYLLCFSTSRTVGANSVRLRHETL